MLCLAFLVFLVAYSNPSSASSEMEYPAYVKTSPSSRAYFRMCPADGYRTDAGSGYIYLVQNAAEDSLLYTVNWFAGRNELYLANDAHYLVRLWSARSFSRSSEAAISFYKDGVLIKEYLKKDIDIESMQGPLYKEPEFAGRGELFRLFTSGHIYVFDVRTGELVEEGME